MKYELILWDFDGTLADTLPLALTAFNRLAADRAYTPITDVAAVRNMSMREFLKSHKVPFYHVPTAFSAFLKDFHSLAEDVPLFDGVRPLLKQISDQGIRQGIVSSNSTDNIRLCLQSNQAEDYFHYVSGTSRIFGKEKRLRKAMSKLKVNAGAVLYVGDEIRDIDAARAAEIDIAAVTWGLNSESAISASDPDYIVGDPAVFFEQLTR